MPLPQVNDHQINLASPEARRLPISHRRICNCGPTHVNYGDAILDY